jgi:hypothetical protein
MAALLVPYIAGYLMLCSVGTGGGLRFRVFNHQWQSVIYRPAAAAETLFTGRPVIAAHRSPEEL